MKNKLSVFVRVRPIQWISKQLIHTYDGNLTLGNHDNTVPRWWHMHYAQRIIATRLKLDTRTLSSNLFLALPMFPDARSYRLASPHESPACDVQN